MNTVKDLALNWWNKLSNREKAKLTFYFDAGRRWECLFEAEIEDIFYQEVILKWYVGKYGKVEFDYNEQQIKEIYLKEHTKEQPQNEWVSCEGYSAQEYPDFKKGWGIECFNGTKGTIEAYQNPYLLIEGQVDKIHKMNVKAYITFEQPQDNTIDVEEVFNNPNLCASYFGGALEVKQPYFKGKGEHSVNELEKMCQQYKDYVSHINSQPKAIEDNVWDEVERILWNPDQSTGNKVAMLKAKYSLIKK